tara:strand:+ start:1668 stop:1946 length:279 start_codon:yes stop_codon:yes gene_type:complete
MTTTIYKQTAVAQKNSKRNAFFAFGRNTQLDGHDIAEGGYAVFTIRDEYVGQAGSLRRKWLLVAKNLSFVDATKLLNRRVGFVAYAEMGVTS